MTGRGKYLISLIYPHCAHALSSWKTPVRSICIEIFRYIGMGYLAGKQERKTTRLSHDLAGLPFACFRFPRRYCQYHPAIAPLRFGRFIDGKDGKLAAPIVERTISSFGRRRKFVYQHNKPQVGWIALLTYVGPFSLPVTLQVVHDPVGFLENSQFDIIIPRRRMMIAYDLADLSNFLTGEIDAFE